MSQPVKSHTQAVLNALFGDHSLSTSARALVALMQWRADGKTGVGWTSQRELARQLGCNEKTIRNLLTEIRASVASPVRIIRERRGRAGGTGRSADTHRVELIRRARP